MKQASTITSGSKDRTISPLEGQHLSIYVPCPSAAAARICLTNEGWSKYGLLQLGRRCTSSFLRVPEQRAMEKFWQRFGRDCACVVRQPLPPLQHLYSTDKLNNNVNRVYSVTVSAGVSISS